MKVGHTIASSLNQSLGEEGGGEELIRLYSKVCLQCTIQYYVGTQLMPCDHHIGSHDLTWDHVIRSCDAH